MRASEALLLGSTMMKPLRGKMDDGHDRGCPLGMIAKATGVHLWDAFPWMVKTRMGAPCDCPILSSDLVCTTPSVADCVMHLFDHHVRAPHVADGKRSWLNWRPFHYPAVAPFWTIEQIAEWVERVDSSWDHVNGCERSFSRIPTVESTYGMQREPELTA